MVLNLASVPVNHRKIARCGLPIFLGLKIGDFIPDFGPWKNILLPAGQMLKLIAREKAWVCLQYHP